MESSPTIFVLVQVAGYIGLPVHLVSAVVAGLFARRRFHLHGAYIVLLMFFWLVAAVMLQALAWQLLPDMPEPVFMILGFMNTPALIGNALLIAVLLASSQMAPRRRARSAAV